MVQARVNGIRIEYDVQGRAEDPALFLVSGFSRQLIDWPPEFVAALVDAGFRVVRFDNRDVGLSARFERFGLPDIGAIVQDVVAGRTPTVAYTLEDMARDVVGLMDVLGIERAHVAGASMGGMITQLTALQHPERVLKIVPIMTTSGAPELPQGTPEAQAMLQAQPENHGRDAVVALSVESRKVIGSAPSMRDPEDRLRALCEASYDRSYDPMGVARQFAGIIATPRWHERLGEVRAPALVLHGRVDPLLPLGCGEDVARRIPGATLSVIDDWGHDLPHSLMARLAGDISAFLKD